jgi:hypothetical protein
MLKLPLSALSPRVCGVESVAGWSAVWGNFSAWRTRLVETLDFFRQVDSIVVKTILICKLEARSR